MATDIGTGTTITFGTSSFTADVLAVNRSGIALDAIDTSHMGTTGYKTFMPTDLVDPGEISVDIAFVGSVSPPIIGGGAAETVTINYAGAGSGHTWACSCFQTAFEASAPLEDKMTGTLTLKCSGAITIS